MKVRTSDLGFGITKVDVKGRPVYPTTSAYQMRLALAKRAIKDRNWKMFEERLRGEMYTSLARRYGVTPSRVRDVFLGVSGEQFDRIRHGSAGWVDRHIWLDRRWDGAQ